MTAYWDEARHPADRLIRDILASGREATWEEAAPIVQRMAEARFPTIRAHLRKRVDREDQWAAGTTEAEYLADLRRAIQDTASRLAVYERRGGHMAAVLAETARIVTGNRQGPASLPLTFVIYSADRGILVTGYQASSISTITVPEDITWLK